MSAGNGIFVLRGEISNMILAMKRGSSRAWNSSSYQNEEQDGLMKNFTELKEILFHVEDLRLVEPNVFLAPFLEVIRSEDTTGPITSLALTAVNKFLSYGLIDPTHPTLAKTIETIANAVTHARFVGTDSSSDAIVLLKIVQVMRTLVLSPEGRYLTNENVCEIILSGFRLCFEPRLNEVLRRNAEHALKDIVQLLFMRLPQFAEDTQTLSLKALKIRATSTDQIHKKRKPSKTTKDEERPVPKISATDENGEQVPHTPTVPQNKQLKPPPLSTTPATPAGNIVDMQGSIAQTPKTSQPKVEDDFPTAEEREKVVAAVDDGLVMESDKLLDAADPVENPDEPDELAYDNKNEDYVNSMGVRFIPQSEEDGIAVNLPYGLPCIRELFRFLITLLNPLDKQNTDAMIHLGLTLLTVSFEVGADNMGKYESLLGLVKDDLCRNLFALLNTERLSIFAADLQVCFLLFESLRAHLKFQLEYYLTKLSDLIVAENPKIMYETRELGLENLLQLLSIPGFAAELYINYDCDLYCANLLEDLTKLLAKNTMNSTTQSIYSVNMLSLDALLTIIQSVERNCVAIRTGNTTNNMRHSRNNSSVDKIVLENDPKTPNMEPIIENINKYIKSPTSTHLNDRFIRVSSDNNEVQPINHEELMKLKNKKRLLTQGTDLFNQRPEKGIQFLQENQILNSVLDPLEVAHFLRENPGLDKKMIGEYISKKKNVESKILEVFVKSFDFADVRIDQALRLYLETFRLPGEAPLIFLVMEHFADHWHTCNGEPFANTDAAFRLAYAIIMLNMDQHNYNAKRLNIPMTAEDFVKNLRGLNGNADFEQEMLTNVYTAIKNEEIIMPAEQTGLVRENYQWKVLLRRGVTKDGVFHHVFGFSHDKEIYSIIWGPTLTALSFIFDKSLESPVHAKSLRGFNKSAAIAAHYNLHEDFDALVLSLCKFTMLLNVAEDAIDLSTSVMFAQSAKAQLAMKCVFGLLHENGDCMRESWKHALDVIIQLFKMRLLPKLLMEAEDFCEATGKVTLIRQPPQLPKVDSGIFSSLYSYLSSDSQRQPSYEEQEMIKMAKRCIRECQIDQIINESKFLQFESLQELIKSILVLLRPPEAHKSVGMYYPEDITVFLLELLIKILIQNRDRVMPVWLTCRDQIYLLLMGATTCDYEYLLHRTTIGLLKLAIYLMRNEELCPVVLQSLKMFLMLKPNTIFKISRHISTGMYELLKTSAQNIHTQEDWAIVFTILECVGAGAMPPDYEKNLQLQQQLAAGTKSDGALSSEDDSGLPDRGYISDSEIQLNQKKAPAPLVASATTTASCTPLLSPSGDNWILVNKETTNDGETQSTTASQSHAITYHCKLLKHSPNSLVKCWDSLAFIVRNVAHITPYNFEDCVRCIRTFVEASFNGGKKNRKLRAKLPGAPRKGGKKDANRKRNKTNGATDVDSSESEIEELPESYQTISVQLLDLMHTLHTRTAQIFRWWAEEGGALPQCSALWSQGWCPLLQGIARLATDQRRQVRTSAITCLQRALLVHDLQTLTGPEWFGCFRQVLFPLLNDLLVESATTTIDPNLMEESRMRTATIMSKVFLHHLTPLIGLDSFSELWLEILEYMERCMKVGPDMLYEAVLESLKNMLLVMHSVRVFHNSDGVTHTQLWDVTWQRIGVFLPNLKDELFREQPVQSAPQQLAEQPPPLQAPLFVPPQQEIQLPITPTYPHVVNLENPVYTLPTSSTAIPQHTWSSNNQPQQPIWMMNPQQQQENHLLFSSIGQSHPLPIFYPQTSVSTPEQPQQLCKNPEYSNIIELPLTPTPPSFDSPVRSIESQQPTPPQSEQTSAQSSPYHLLSPPVGEVAAAATETEPPVPISHLMMENHYPSLKNKNIPIGIAQSFSPVYIQPTNQTMHSTNGGGEIYGDYVQNPYNLTLAVKGVDTMSFSNAQCNVTSTETINQSMTIEVATDASTTTTSSNMFQSANYFGATTQKNVNIPPGSEMLFGANPFEY